MSDQFDEKYRKQLARTMSVLNSIAKSKYDVELNMTVFYALDAAQNEIKSFHHDQGFDPDERTYNVMAALDIFCRQTKLILDLGIAPEQLRDKIDPHDGIRLFCELCAEALSLSLREDEAQAAQVVDHPGRTERSATAKHSAG